MWHQHVKICLKLIFHREIKHTYNNFSKINFIFKITSSHTGGMINASSLAGTTACMIVTAIKAVVGGILILVEPFNMDFQYFWVWGLCITTTRKSEMLFAPPSINTIQFCVLWFLSPSMTHRTDPLRRFLTNSRTRIISCQFAI